MNTESAYGETEARSYDDDRRVERHWEREHDYVRVLLGHTAPARLLDAPVGTGRFFPLYARIRTVAGIDLSESMLAQSRRRAGTSELSRLLLARGSVTQLPFADGAFELTLCCRLLHLLPPELLAPAFRELARVTAGRVCVQAYVRGSLWLRARGRMQRELGRFDGARKREQPWAHIQAYSHSEASFHQAAVAAGLRLLQATELDRYYGTRVVMFLWQTS
ncbi:MAG: class I SAM-dependent methyltransferase [Polyangiales bacterium]